MIRGPSGAPFYLYPTSHGGIAVGDRVTVGAGTTVYTVERIQVRTSDQHAIARVRSDRSRHSYVLDTLRVVPGHPHA